MKPLRVLVIDTSEHSAETVKKKLLNHSSIRFIVTASSVANAEETFADISHRLEMVLFSDKLTFKAMVQLTKYIRTRDLIVPV